ncbi:hypothetical protein OC845_005968 [Tilletia horrida]|nr:hypothetical protein OC845_005968 [Tilletia horrida]
MRTTFQALLVILAAVLVQAAPSINPAARLRQRNVAFSSPVKNEIQLLRRNLKHKPDALLHERLNLERARALSRNRRRQAGQKMSERDAWTELGDNGDGTYYAAVTVGTPPTTVPLLIDTGSSDLWISSQYWNGSSSSSTFSPNGQIFNVTYADQTNAVGYQGTDQVQFAGVSAQTALSVATELGEGVVEPATAGIFGFGWPVLATGNATPFWLTSGVNIFAMYMTASEDLSDEYSFGGVMSLGQPESSYYTGAINYVALTEKSYWQVALDGITVRGYSLPISDFEAMIDSGTAGITAPDDVVASFYAAIPNARQTSESSLHWEYPCDQTNLDITFTFGDYSYTIPDASFQITSSDSEGYCVGAMFSTGLSTAETAGPQIILGDTFMRQFYIVFDGTRPAIGFAQLSQQVPRTGPDFSLGETASSTSSGGSSSQMAASSTAAHTTAATHTTWFTSGGSYVSPTGAAFVSGSLASPAPAIAATVLTITLGLVLGLVCSP